MEQTKALAVFEGKKIMKKQKKEKLKAKPIDYQTKMLIKYFESLGCKMITCKNEETTLISPKERKDWKIKAKSKNELLKHHSGLIT